MVAQTPLVCVALKATQSMGINTDPSCSWTMDPNMVIVFSPGQNVTSTVVCKASHSDKDGTQQLNGPQIPTQPPAAAQIHMTLNSKRSYGYQCRPWLQ